MVLYELCHCRYKEKHREVEAIFLKNVFVLISTERDNVLRLFVTGSTMQDVGKGPGDVTVLGFVFEFSPSVYLMHSGGNRVLKCGINLCLKSGH